MQAAKEKISNVASAAKERIDHHKAKLEEKIDKAEGDAKEEARDHHLLDGHEQLMVTHQHHGHGHRYHYNGSGGAPPTHPPPASDAANTFN